MQPEKTKKPQKKGKSKPPLTKSKKKVDISQPVSDDEELTTPELKALEEKIIKKGYDPLPEEESKGEAITGQEMEEKPVGQEKPAILDINSKKTRPLNISLNEYYIHALDKICDALEQDQLVRPSRRAIASQAVKKFVDENKAKYGIS